jgi:hypothetical protein
MRVMTNGPAPAASTRPLAGDSDLPADPARYDSPRAVAARRRGLEAPYIPGGDDPDLARTLEREGRDTRLLVGMAVAIVLMGFVLGILGAIIGLSGLVTGGDGEILVRMVVA